jgi:hypothetical protein
MSTVKFMIASLVLLVPLCAVLFSAEGEETKATLEKRSSFIVLPVIYYSPETRWAGGVGGIWSFRPGKSPEKGRPSFIPFMAIYTQNRQFMLNLSPEFYLGDGSTIIIGKLDLKKYPDKFFGIGNNTRLEMEENYTQRQVSFEISAQKKLWANKDVFAGLYYGFDHYAFPGFEPEGQLVCGTITGSPGGTTSGLGIVLRRDNRDNVLFPTKGHLCQFSATIYSSVFGSEYNYRKLNADVRVYVPVFRTHVLAFQGVFRATSGTVPFMALARLGSDGILRGYNSARYRDNTLAAIQVEYRLPVWWRFGMVGFAGYGQVADGIGRLKIGEFKYSVGLGIRFRIDPKEGTNIRLDFGFGKGSWGNYLTGGEAF